MMFRVFSALLLLQSFASRPIPINRKECREPEANLKEESFDIEPGAGNFRDPLEILGMKFPESRILHLCKADLYMYADKISDVRFPPDGVKLCRSVCDGYMDTMAVDSGVTISLATANCDYTGKTIIVERSANGTHPAVCPDLSTSCVCTYHIRCNRRTRSVIYTFSPNRRGFVRVDFTIHTKRTYIT